jgi:hypothetical protein
MQKWSRLHHLLVFLSMSGVHSPPWRHSVTGGYLWGWKEEAHSPNIAGTSPRHCLPALALVEGGVPPGGLSVSQTVGVSTPWGCLRERFVSFEGHTEVVHGVPSAAPGGVGKGGIHRTMLGGFEKSGGALPKHEEGHGRHASLVTLLPCL